MSFLNHFQSQGVAEEGEGKKIANSYSEQLNARLKEVDSHTPSVSDDCHVTFQPVHVSVWCALFRMRLCGIGGRGWSLLRQISQSGTQVRERAVKYIL